MGNCDARSITLASEERGENMLSIGQFLLGIALGCAAGYIFGQVIVLALDIACLTDKVCY